MKTTILHSFLKAGVALCLVLCTLTVQGQVIVIDPGHGYNATGGNPDTRTETEIVTALEVGLKLKDQLNSECSNYTVRMTRSTRNGWISLAQRRELSNSWNADRFLSIHCNAGGGTGTETFWCNRTTPNQTTSAQFSQEVQNRMAADGSWASRRSVEDLGYLTYHLGVLNGNNAVGVLSEIGFVDRATDAAKLLDDAWRDKFAAAYVKAIKTSLGVTCTQAPPNYTQIEAENYATMAGVDKQTCLDTGGGENIHNIATGDWAAYSNVSFPATGAYTIQYRVASLSSTGIIKADLNEGATELGTINVPATGGPQTWTTISQTVNIATAGTYTLRLLAAEGGWNLNWIRIIKQDDVVTGIEDGDLAEDFDLYPNPADNSLSVRFTGRAASANVLNTVGQKVLSLPAVKSGEPIDISSLKSGVYMLDLVIDGKKVIKRFIKR
ncbi:N-acetylmuramoyl-L-alanine amidase [Rufibacter sp. LB8]|uniref:N-acetylmuramoyl-L-alanine amidase n=1 Tax=Rufibacter sp. LB8 TaxID=2777781 RepID=UPI00178C5FC7|nr:N-acetylmuramoyl-L-alanine amidase [Rufibacter sp. LB8]